MAVVNIRPDEKSITGKIDKYRSYQTSYIVITDDALTNPLEIFVALASGSFPVGTIRKGAYAVWDTGCICKDVSINQEEQLTWLATASWSNEPSEPGQTDEDGNPVDNPLDAYPVMSWGSKAVEVFLKADVNGKLYENSAGDPINPPPPITLNRNILTVQTNEEDFDPEENEYYSGTCNSNIFFGYSPKRCMFLSKTGDMNTWTDEDNITQVYYKCTYTFEFLNGTEPDLLPLELANVGMRVNDGTKLINIVVAEGTEDAAMATEPVPLDLSGAGIQDEIDYIEFENYYTTDYDFFADWGLG